LAERRRKETAATAPALRRPRMLFVTQVRQALQQAVAIGACSEARLTSGSARAVVRSNMLVV
jgi:hypothetical protein